MELRRMRKRMTRGRGNDEGKITKAAAFCAVTKMASDDLKCVLILRVDGTHKMLAENGMRLEAEPRDSIISDTRSKAVSAEN